MEERAVITYIRSGDEILLIHKKRGHGAGKVNGLVGFRVIPAQLDREGGHLLFFALIISGTVSSFILFGGVVGLFRGDGDISQQKH